VRVAATADPGKCARVVRFVTPSAAESAPRRDRIFRRDGFRCVYCGEELPAEWLTLDHVEPRMRGGDTSEGNLVTSCRTCNAAKAGEPAWSYLARHADVRTRFLAAVAASDTRYARPVWPRLLRAIEEAASRT
jgi:hypothetical protein